MSRQTDPMAGTADDYAGPPPRPDPWTTTEPHEGMRDNHEARVISLAPDVCLTPCGSGMVPVPYPVVDYGDHMANYADSVRLTKQRAMVLRSNTTHVHGDEAGTGGGVKSGTHNDITEPIGHAPRVNAERSPMIRDGDLHWMNKRNTIGEANFKRDLKTYDPPTDDDPAPGSMRRTSGETQVAQAAPQTMTDASPNMLPASPAPNPAPPPASPPGDNVIRPNVPQWNNPPPKPPAIPMPEVPPAVRGAVTLRRFGFWGTVIGASVWPNTTAMPWDDEMPADEGERRIFEEAKKLRRAGVSNDDVNTWFKKELSDYRKNKQNKTKQDEQEEDKNRNPSLKPGTVRSSGEDKPNPCLLHKYGDSSCHPGYQNHHAVADRAFRSTARPSSYTQMWDTTGHTNNMSLGEGLATCLYGSSTSPTSEHGIATSVYETAIAQNAQNGMVRLGTAETAAANGVQAGTHGRCKASEILAQLRAYHQSKGMGPDTLVRQKVFPLDATQTPLLGSKAAGVSGR